MISTLKEALLHLSGCIAVVYSIFIYSLNFLQKSQSNPVSNIFYNSLADTQRQVYMTTQNFYLLPSSELSPMVSVHLFFFL